MSTLSTSNNQIYIELQSSREKIEAVIFEKDQEGVPKIVSVFSCCLGTEVENFSVAELEIFAFVKVYEQFFDVINNRQVILITDSTILSILVA